MRLSFGSLRLTVGYTAAAALTAALLLDREGRIACCLAAAVLHELGHLLMLRLLRVRVRAVSLRLFDTRIEADRPDTPAGAVVVTLAGPAMNLLLAAASFRFSRAFCYANAALGLFNLLPVLSLDGGRLLYLLLSRRFSDTVCMRVMKAVTFAAALPLMTAGIFVLLRSGYNVSLLIVSLYLLAVLLIKPEQDAGPFV